MRSAALFPILLLASCEFYYRPDPGPTAGDLPNPRAAEQDKFRSIAEAYIAWVYANHPTRATSDGVHDFDGRLGSFSRAHLEGQAEALRQHLRRLSLIDTAALDDENYFDALILENQIRAALLELERVGNWRRNPNFYRAVIARGLYSLAALAFDTPERRMVLAADRLSDVPVVLSRAKENLRNPPRLYLDISLEEFAGTHGFIKKDLPAAFAGVTHEATRKKFADAQKAALEAVEQFVDWMRKDLSAQAVPEFAIGAEDYRAKLLYEEMVDTPLEELLGRGYDLLRETQDALKSLAGEKGARAVLRENGRDHPDAGHLLDETRKTLADLKQWASTVVDLPADADCKVQETPSFRRSLSFASMEIPGPFERVAKDAYYSVTLPDPAWPPEKKEQHLSFFNRYSLPLISAHEAYPGHYAQFLAVRECPSKVRKVFGCGSFSEGWAHYCEELYVTDAHASEPAPYRYRIQQLSLALLRICRYIVGIEMHTKGMTYERGVEFFVNEGYLERTNAEREARRGTMDPTYLVYTLGKMEILKLRDDYRRATGKSLREFHNEFIRHGYPPLKVMRMILLGRGP